ncbi:MAG: urea carboxylase-associated family protein [Rhodospirillales bacterium]|nr:urea carboxylase-associated family protein [Rhodospirillales bacterium]
MSGRTIVSEYVIEPGTGKAFELLKGQIIRIEQIEGGQCVDFNCFNLHDYKEFMHTGRTRTLYGLTPSTGDFLWSAPPRERPMLYIVEDTAHINDVIFPYCSAYLYENSYGLPKHTNCNDIQAEAQREYGLTPDDVHDSFNLFMDTGVNDNGDMYINRQNTQPGDYVEFLALFDVLAVPNICGADVLNTSNYSLKPVKVTIYQATSEELASVPYTASLPSQRTPKDFRNSTIKADRELCKDAAYSPEFTNVPIVVSDLEITLSDEEYAMLDDVRLTELYGDNDGDALRDVVFAWWAEHFIKYPHSPE